MGATVNKADYLYSSMLRGREERVITTITMPASQ